MYESTAPLFSTIAPGAMVDPFPAYHRLRTLDPVHWSEEEHVWFVSRYKDVAALMADPTIRVIELHAIVGNLTRLAGKDTPDLESVLKAMLFFRNPPQHGEERRFLVAVLNATPVSALAAVIEKITDKLLVPFRETGRMDAVLDFADRLPPLVLARLLGIPDELVDDLMQSVSEVTMSFDRGRSVHFYERINRSVANGRETFLEAIAERRRQPRDDGLSRMIALSDAQYHLDDGVIASRAMLLLAAGVETTSSSIGNAIKAILEHPDAAEEIRRRPEAIEGAVEEAIRYDTPVQHSSRLATVDLQIGDRLVKAGDRLVLLMGAANRDPEVFDRPDVFDIGRDGPPHLGFGAATHFCIGATLARLEIRIALTRLLALRPEPVPRQKGERWPHRTIRRLKSYRVTIPETAAEET